MVLLGGPRRGVFFMSEVPLWRRAVREDGKGLSDRPWRIVVRIEGLGLTVQDRLSLSLSHTLSLTLSLSHTLTHSLSLPLRPLLLRVAPAPC